ncbi:hypothetical protein Fmac_023037 [Flemingia macrophylla]|uniref:Uncharacterized protein n=1 Tax=Flemingia macrophylla TaxID=520843 RepID=A0ABD1LKD2_9FABA
MKNSNKITESSLRMGLECVQGTWIPKGDAVEEVSRIEPADDMPTEDVPPPPNLLVLQRIEEMMAMQREHQEKNRRNSSYE